MKRNKSMLKYAMANPFMNNIVMMDYSKIKELDMMDYSKIKELDDYTLRHYRDQFGWTPLHRAAYEGDIEFMQRCLDCRIPVGAIGKGVTPIHRCILGMRYHDNIEAMNFLFLNGATLNKDDIKIYELHKEYFVEQSGDLKKIMK